MKRPTGHYVLYRIRRRTLEVIQEADGWPKFFRSKDNALKYKEDKKLKGWGIATVVKEVYNN